MDLLSEILIKKHTTDCFTYRSNALSESVYFFPEALCDVEPTPIFYQTIAEFSSVACIIQTYTPEQRTQRPTVESIMIHYAYRSALCQ